MNKLFKSPIINNLAGFNFNPVLWFMYFYTAISIKTQPLKTFTDRELQRKQFQQPKLTTWLRFPV